MPDLTGDEYTGSGRQCKATSRSGQRCKKPAAQGALVCRNHGAEAPQVKRASARRIAITEAQRLIQIDGVEMDPIDYLVDALKRAYQWMRVWGVMVADLDDFAEERAREEDALRGELLYLEASGDAAERRGESLMVTTHEQLLGFNYRGEAGIHPFVERYEQGLERVAKMAKLCLDAGIDEARLQLEAKQVDIAVRAFEAMLDELGLNGDQKEEARETYARHLRAV